MVSTGWQQESLVQIDLLKLGSENHSEMLASDAFHGPGRIFEVRKSAYLDFQKVPVKFASETDPFLAKNIHRHLVRFGKAYLLFRHQAVSLATEKITDLACELGVFYLVLFL